MSNTFVVNMKKMNLIIIIAIFIIALFCFYYGLYNIKNLSFDNTSKINKNNSSIEQQININDSKLDNTTKEEFVIPPSDYVVNNINWSNYPDLKKGYVASNYVTYTKEVGKNFISVEICTEIVSNQDNVTKIKNELYEVGCEAKQYYGSAAAIHVLGTINGATLMVYTIIPYNMTINDLNTSE
jgi:hypothetical protein